jgi:hypothetical protein
LFGVVFKGRLLRLCVLVVNHSTGASVNWWKCHKAIIQVR